MTKNQAEVLQAILGAQIVSRNQAVQGDKAVISRDKVIMDKTVIGDKAIINKAVIGDEPVINKARGSTAKGQDIQIDMDDIDSTVVDG